MRTFKKRNPVLVKVESSPNSKKVTLFNDINSDDEKKDRRRKKFLTIGRVFLQPQ